MIDLTTGWVQHPGISGGWHLEYVDPVCGFNISIVTGPKGSGLMGVIAPGQPTTYEAWLPGLSNPTGYLTLDEIRGIIMYLREKHRDEAMVRLLTVSGLSDEEFDARAAMAD